MRNLSPALCVLLLVVPAVASAQGILVDVRPDREFRLPRPRPEILPHPRPIPQPPQSYKIKQLSVNATLSDQIAKVQLSQSFVNTGGTAMEVSFIFPLPYDGAVDRMTFMVDGKEHQARLLSADEARRIYESYIRRNKDPALLEWMGTGMFKTSVFPVPPGAERTVTMRYSQLCRRSGGLSELYFPLSTAKYTSHAVENVSINVTIQSQSPIKNVYSPTHSVEIKRPSDIQAKVSFSSANEVPTTDFRLFFDVGYESVGASVLSYRPDKDEHGYFLLLLSPEIKRASEKPVRKTVVFVVDRSGSMAGTKIEQAKGALKFVLNNLNEGDLFNIIAYDNAVESFRPELQRYGDESRKQALGFVEGIYAGGSTNIDGALKAALSQLQDESQPSYVIFLTDGLPTAGETKEQKIVINAKERNKVRARVFSMGVGYDVNSRMLDKLARTCFGQSEYVRPNEDIEAAVGKLYSRIGAPAMIDLAVDVEMKKPVNPEDGSPVSRLYPRDAYDLFAGDQLVMAGRYKYAGAAKVLVRGKVDGEVQKFEFAAKFVEHSADETHAFVEKLWAMRRIGEIIDEIDLHGKNQELIDELVALSTKHGILTPYTSFLAEENSDIRDLAGNFSRANQALDALGRTSGRAGFAQREAKGRLQRAATAPAAEPGLRVLDAEADEEIIVRTVQNVGRKTFYRRDGQWVDAALTAAQEKQVKKLERYSKEFFDLVGKHGQDVSKYLAIEGDVTVVLDGQAYSF